MDGATTPEGAGRRTRAALAEIPLRLDRLRMTNTPLQPLTNTPLQPLTNTPLQPLTNTPLQPLTNMRDRDRSPALPPGYLSPAPSPDEMVIQQRGRRLLPVTWSPDIELKRNSSFHSVIRTPPKETSSRLSPPKLGVTLRSTPRKRLLLGDTDRIPLTPEKIDFSDISTPQKLKLNSPVKRSGSPPAKRCRVEKKFAEYRGPIDVALKGLSPVQLVNIIKGIVSKHPDVETELRQDMPTPDLAPLEEKLSYLKSNISKSLPNSRLASRTDSPAFSRVSTHLAAFKKALVDQGKVLLESQHWEAVVQYSFLAWNYVRATPVWDNQLHNVQRKQCFKALINFCMTAVKKGGLERSFLVVMQDKLQGMVADSEEVQSCLKYVQGQLKVFP